MSQPTPLNWSRSAVRLALLLDLAHREVERLSQAIGRHECGPLSPCPRCRLLEHLEEFTRLERFGDMADTCWATLDTPFAVRAFVRRVGEKFDTLTSEQLKLVESLVGVPGTPRHLALATVKG